MNEILSIPAPTACCPECEGTGEIYRNMSQNEWGVWDYDADECVVCEGNGEVSLFVLDEYTEWIQDREAA